MDRLCSMEYPLYFTFSWKVGQLFLDAHIRIKKAVSLKTNSTYGNGGSTMYTGRDMTELSMTPKNKWKTEELSYFHHALQQIMPYLNAEGQTLHREITEEIMRRGGLTKGAESD